jgi:hypothetical protein
MRHDRHFLWQLPGQALWHVSMAFVCLRYIRSWRGHKSAFGYSQESAIGFDFCFNLFFCSKARLRALERI